MRQYIDIVRRLAEGVKDHPQFIENPNSSGQGQHPEHDQHPFHGTLMDNGYMYSHTTPIRAANGGFNSHHTYKHLDHRDNVVGISQRGWEAGKLGQTRRTHGKTPEALQSYLRGHLRRTARKTDIDPGV